LTPRCRGLRVNISSMQRQIRQLRQENENLRQNLRDFSSDEGMVNLLAARLNQETQDFIRGQLQLQNVPPTGRRYTLEDKLKSVLLLKLSSKVYTHLRQKQVLPSRKTLERFLGKIPVVEGFCPNVLELLKTEMVLKPETEKLAVLMWDEMSLKLGLRYTIPFLFWKSCL
jgi:hypothetical protein